MPGAPPTRAGLVQQAEQAGSRVQLAAGLLHATHKLLAQVARSIVSVLSLMLVEVSFKAEQGPFISQRCLYEFVTCGERADARAGGTRSTMP